MSNPIDKSDIKNKTNINPIDPPFLDKSMDKYNKGYEKVFNSINERKKLREIFEKEAGESATWRYDREDFFTEKYVEWLESKVINNSSNQKLTSDIFDEDGREIELGDKVQLTFNEGEFSEHKAVFDVIWNDAAYKIKSEIGKESFLGAMSHSVKIDVINSR